MKKSTSLMKPMKRGDITDLIAFRKVILGIKWAAVAKKVGQSKEWTTAACLGQMQMTQKQAETVGKIFDLPEEAVLILQTVPYKGSLPTAVPTDPLIYRWYEIVSVYGTTIKELIHEEFGDGIVMMEKFLKKEFIGKEFQILWPSLDSEVIIQISDCNNENNTLSSLLSSSGKDNTSSSENGKENNENRKKLRQKIALLRSTRQTVAASEIANTGHHTNSSTNTSSSSSSSTKASSKSWKMYYLMISKNSQLVSILPKPCEVVEKREEYLTLIQSPLFNHPKQKPMRDYLEICLSS